MNRNFNGKSVGLTEMYHSVSSLELRMVLVRHIEGKSLLINLDLHVKGSSIYEVVTSVPVKDNT